MNIFYALIKTSSILGQTLSILKINIGEESASFINYKKIGACLGRELKMNIHSMSDILVSKKISMTKLFLKPKEFFDMAELYVDFSDRNNIEIRQTEKDSSIILESRCVDIYDNLDLANLAFEFF